MAFHEVRFPVDLSFGAIGGPERRTEIVTLANGHEERNTPWSGSLRRWDAGLGLRSLDDIETLIAFFEARGGQLHGFRWKDWSDYRSARPSEPLRPTDQPLGVGDGMQTAFPLQKLYASGGHSHLRSIAKPVASSLRVAVDGAEVAGGWSVDAVTGVIHFTTPPAADAVLSAGFEFDVPVRFDTDRLQISLATFEAGEVPRVPVVEIRT